MYAKKNIITFIIFIFFSVVIYLLFTKQLIYPTIIPMVRSDAANIFTDWTVILQANLCYEKGFDVFLDNPCDYWQRKHVYGEILLYLPFIKDLPKFYFLIFPIIINLIFILTIVRLFTYNENIKYFSIFLFIINPPVLLAIERANIDIIIFLLTVLMAKNKNLILNHITIILVTISKFYPICLSILFFFEKGIKKIIVNLIIVLLSIFVLLIFQWDNLIKIFDNQNQFTAHTYGVYEFSFLGGYEFIKNLSIFFENKDYFWIKYAYIFFIVLVPVMIVNFNFFKKLKKDYLIDELLIENNFENKLYILSSTLILLCYFLFSNFIYREIFFLGLIPFILKNEKKIISNNFFIFYFYILSFKFIFSSVLIYSSRNNIFQNFEPIIIVLKHTVDFYIISIVLLIFVIYLKNFYKNILKEINN